MEVVRKPNKKPELKLSFRAVGACWKYRGYLVDPRLFVTDQDGGVLMSAPTNPGAEFAYLAQLYGKLLGKTKISNLSFVISYVDWKYGENVHDKRLVFYCESGEVYTSGPFPVTVNVPLLAQSFCFSE
jgi:hypothetical protein